MKLISWNVNGLRACLNKGFYDFFKSSDADIFCLGETKMTPGQAEINTEGYFEYWNSAEKKGYSGVAIFTKKKPLSASYGLSIEKHDHEGRIITLEFDKFYLVNCYTPNSKDGLLRLDYRMEWDDDFREYLINLDKIKPVVFCGDLNVAHTEIDLKNPRSNRRNAGFTDEERGKFTALLNSGFCDTFRYLNPDKKDAYTWWSYRFNARSNNVGWRIDYFCISDRIKNKIINAKIHNDIYGSDHCPVELILDI